MASSSSGRRCCTCKHNATSGGNMANGKNIKSLSPTAETDSSYNSGRGNHRHNRYSSSSSSRSNDLDASFVYLPPDPSSAAGGGTAACSAGELLLHQFACGVHELYDGSAATAGVGGEGGGGGSRGSLALVGAARHAALLADIAKGERGGGVAVSADQEGDDDKEDEGVALCRVCVERIARAIDADTARYEREIQAYEVAVGKEEDRERQIRQALSLNAEVANADAVDARQQQSGDELVGSAADAFGEDIAILTAAVSEYEQELEQLNALLDEQVERAADLSREEDLLFMDRNVIEIDAREFDNVSRQLASRCSEAHGEVMALSSVNLHAALFEIHVAADGKGSHYYPQINGMRLAHRPKGDLGWAEINCAWASAAQLLLFVGSTVKFTSRDLRIVPMTSCAKIMEISDKKKFVYNLGKELDRGDGRNGSSGGGGGVGYRSRRSESMIPSIRAFNALLFQVLEHILGEKKSLPVALRNKQPPLFSMTRSAIGSHDLHEEDGTAAVEVIHCIAKNLQWLVSTATTA